MDILYRGDVANKITSRLTVGGAEQARFDIIIDNELNFNKFALSWKQNRVKFLLMAHNKALQIQVQMYHLQIHLTN